MAKKNLGKVKRYRRSFYTGRQRITRTAGIVILLIVLFLAGWLVGPAVINFGSNLWYSIVNPTSGETFKPQSVQSEVSSGSVTSEPESQPEPVETPAPAIPAADERGWAFVNAADVADAEKAKSTAAALAQQGVGFVVIPMKDSTGSLYYASNLEQAQGSLASVQISGADVADAFVQQGIIPVAGICAFQDPIASSVNRSMAVMYQDTDYLWLDAAADAGGKSWLNPYSAQAVEYISAVIDEVKALGFEQIWLSGVQFPTVSGRDMASYGDTAGISESQCLASALSQWQEKAVCWVEYPLNVASGAETRLTGGTIDALGIENLAVRVNGELTEEVKAQLETVKIAAGAKNYVGVRSGEGFTVEAVKK